MRELREKGIQKLIETSAYIAILNNLRSKNKITDTEYEKIKKKIEKNPENDF